MSSRKSLRLLALERGHELLVVDPERVRRVVRDRRKRPADLGVLVHRAPAILHRERVPGSDLHERVDDEVGRPARDDAPWRAPRVALEVLRRAGCREVRVRRLSQPASGVALSVGGEVAEVLVALGQLPEHEVGLGPDADEAVRSTCIRSCPRLDHLGERLLGRLALLHGQPAPRRIERGRACTRRTGPGCSRPPSRARIVAIRFRTRHVRGSFRHVWPRTVERGSGRGRRRAGGRARALPRQATLAA